MYSIALIAYYGGTIPEYIEPWLLTCKANPTIDFILIVDDNKELQLPRNVKKYIFSLDDLRERIQEHFDFKIQLPRAYKMCDFRPAYGEIFSDLLCGYDYWGHCDIDVLFGNIRSFLTDDVLEKNDRIYTAGPLSLYKNNPIVNSYYKTLPVGDCYVWKDVFSSPKSFAYDESSGGKGFSAILHNNGIPIASEGDAPYALDDLWWSGAPLKETRDNKKYYCIHFAKGKLFLEEKGGNSIEAPYIHLTRRLDSVFIGENLGDDFYFLPVAYFVKNRNDKYVKRIVGCTICNIRVAIFQSRIWLGARKRELLALISGK